MSMDLEKAQALSVGELSKLSAFDLMQLQLEADEVFKKAKSLKEWIDGSIALKYEDQIRSLRQQSGKDTGVVHIEDGGMCVTSDLSKKPSWDQQKLAEIVNRITQSGDDPSEFIDISYKVSERKYGAWPSSLKEVFAPARTLKTGKPTFRLNISKEQ